MRTMRTSFPPPALARLVPNAPAAILCSSPIPSRARTCPVVFAFPRLALGRQHGPELGKALGQGRGDLVLRQAFLPAEKLARGAPLEHASADSAQAGFVPNQFQHLSRSGAVDLLAEGRFFRDHDGGLEVFEQASDLHRQRYPNGVPTVAETLHAPVEQQRRAFKN